MLNSFTYATAALELAREGRWSVAYWLLERAVRSAPVHLLEEYLELMLRARALASREMLLGVPSVGLA
jgi:hypothetical protein